MRSGSKLAMTLLFCAAWTGQVRAWTSPLEISQSSSNERSTPRIARGAVTGNLYVVWVNKSSPWQCWFRQRSAAGVWGSVEQISGTQFATRMEVIEDTQGRPHVFYASYNTGGSLDIVHKYRDSSTWVSEYVSPTTQYEDQPQVAIDTAGRIHMLFNRTGVESGSGSLVYRAWTAGNWGAEYTLGHVEKGFFNRARITIDAAGTLHATWTDSSGSSWKTRYARCPASGSWSAASDIASNANFLSYSCIAAPSANNIVVVWHVDADGGVSDLYYNYSNNGGANWTFAGTGAGQRLYAGHMPAMDDGNGVAHLVSNRQSDGKALLYSQWSGTSWTTLQQVVFADSYWKGWPDIVAEPSGALHTVWDEVYGSGETWEHYIAYASTAADTVPPGPVTGFSAVAGFGSVALQWTNPSDPDFQRTIIRASTSGYPATVNDGTLVVNAAAAPGSTGSYVHSGLVNGTRYYYAAFARDAGGLSSAAANAQAMPFVPPDIDRDGDVDASDFGILQSCLTGAYTPQSEPACQNAFMDADNDVDDDDVAIFEGCFSGPEVAYVPTCAD